MNIVPTCNIISTKNNEKAVTYLWFMDRNVLYIKKVKSLFKMIFVPSPEGLNFLFSPGWFSTIWNLEIPIQGAGAMYH